MELFLSEEQRHLLRGHLETLHWYRCGEIRNNGSCHVCGAEMEKHCKCLKEVKGFIEIMEKPSDVLELPN